MEEIEAKPEINMSQDDFIKTNKDENRKMYYIVPNQLKTY